jgi:hypothetical protein
MFSKISPDTLYFQDMCQHQMKRYTGCWEKSFTTVTVWRVLQKCLHLKEYKLSIIQHLTDADNVVRKEFCMQMFYRI